MSPESPAKTVRQHEKKEGYLQHAWEELYRAREQDGRPLGKLLADAMADSTETLTRVGGFIMFFAALIRLLDSSGVLQWLCLPLGWFLSPFWVGERSEYGIGRRSVGARRRLGHGGVRAGSPCTAIGSDGGDRRLELVCRYTVK